MSASEALPASRGLEALPGERNVSPRRILFALAVLCACSSRRPGTTSSDAGVPASVDPSTSVLEHHNGPRRNGLYVDPSLTRAAAASFHPDPTFQAAVPGSIFGQLLYAADGAGNADLVIAVTEENDVAAFAAASGATVWSVNLGPPVPLSELPCGDIDPLGITGTPVLDPATRTLYLDAMTTPDGGRTLKHLVFALSLDDGSTRPGWPVDVGARASFGGTAFTPAVQNQRGALALVGGTLYVPYGGHYGDCGDYHGWVVGVSTSDPSVVKAWATTALAGGVWGPSGVASDGTSLFVTTGNTMGAGSTWAGGDAVIRLAAGPVFSGQRADYFAPSDWPSLDANDQDLAGTGPLLLDLPGATPSQLLVALGKDGNLYLVDRSALGGVGGEVAMATVSTSEIINAAASYTTALGTYVAFKGDGAECPGSESGDLTAVRIVPGAPPTVTTAWCAQQGGLGSPMVTTTDGQSESIVWSVGAEGDERLRGFDGDTGQVLYASGSLGSVRRYVTPILAKGRLFVPVDGGVKAFTR